jgi:hypothetical protein
MAKEELLAFADEYGVKAQFTFVPFSFSRNKEQKHRSLNWVVLLEIRGKHLSSFDYSQGMGHAPCHQKNSGFHGKSIYDRNKRHEAEVFESEKGLIAVQFGGGTKRIPPPAIEDILCCLAMDSYILDALDFDEWLAEMGGEYFKGAHGVYERGCRQAKELQRILGVAGLEKLRVAAQDY